LTPRRKLPRFVTPRLDTSLRFDVWNRHLSQISYLERHWSRGTKSGETRIGVLSAASPTYGVYALRYERKRMMAQSCILMNDD
jgi:hypothetical protein